MSPILIKNIYTMLCYAWETLTPDKNKFVGSEDFENIHNLLASLMLSGCYSILKQGVHHEYDRTNETISGIKGKLNLANTIKYNTLLNCKINCDFDIYSSNSNFNQIIKTTVCQILQNSYIKKEIKRKLALVLKYFGDINTIKITSNTFKNITYNNNNAYYRQLICICELFFEGLIAEENGKTIEFLEFIRDRKMALLYEKFILNFYKKHLDYSVYKVHSPKIEWIFDENISVYSENILPEMKSDIVIENKLTNDKLIIDTKYYSEALIWGRFSSTKKVRNTHLYQLNTYLNNLKCTAKKKGILLFPSSDEEIDSIFPFKGQHIKVKTINLNSQWESIYKTLINLVESSI